jgi:hypothetical protein
MCLPSGQKQPTIKMRSFIPLHTHVPELKQQKKDVDNTENQQCESPLVETTLEPQAKVHLLSTPHDANLSFAGLTF